MKIQTWKYFENIVGFETIIEEYVYDWSVGKGFVENTEYKPQRKMLVNLTTS